MDDRIYEGPTRTLLVFVSPGGPLDREQIAADALLRGTRTPDGPVAQVAYVFLGGLDEANDALPLLRASGLEVRALGPEGDEVVLSPGRAPGGRLPVAPPAPARGAPAEDPGAAEVRRANLVARYALALGVLSFCCVNLAGVLAMPLGMIALSHADATHAVVAKAGIGLGALGLLLSLVSLLA